MKSETAMIGERQGALIDRIVPQLGGRMPYDRSRPGLLLHPVLDDGGLSAVRVGTEYRLLSRSDRVD